QALPGRKLKDVVLQAALLVGVKPVAHRALPVLLVLRALVGAQDRVDAEVLPPRMRPGVVVGVQGATVSRRQKAPGGGDDEAGTLHGLLEGHRGRPFLPCARSSDSSLFSSRLSTKAGVSLTTGTR